MQWTIRLNIAQIYVLSAQNARLEELKSLSANLSVADSRAWSVKANKRHNTITAGTIERISTILVESFLTAEPAREKGLSGKR